MFEAWTGKIPWRKVKVKSLSPVGLFATPWTVAHQAPLSMEFSRPEYCSGLSFPFPGEKRLAYNAGALGSVPGSGRSPGEGNGNPLQYSGLENPMGRAAWQATVHGVTQSQTRLKRLSTHARATMILKWLPLSKGQTCSYHHCSLRTLIFSIGSSPSVQGREENHS